MIWVWTTIPSLLVALNSFVRAVMMPHSPRPLLASFTLP